MSDLDSTGSESVESIQDAYEIVGKSVDEAVVGDADDVRRRDYTGRASRNTSLNTNRQYYNSRRSTLNSEDEAFDTDEGVSQSEASLPVDEDFDDNEDGPRRSERARKIPAELSRKDSHLTASIIKLNSMAMGKELEETSQESNLDIEDPMASFGKQLSGIHIEEIRSQMKVGKRMSRLMANFFSELAKVQNEYSQSMYKFIDLQKEEYRKFISNGNTDKMKCLSEGWELLLEKLGSVAKAGEVLSAEIGTQLHDSLYQNYQVCKRNVEKLDSEVYKVLEPLNDVRTKIKKSRAKKNKILNDALRARGILGSSKKKKAKDMALAMETCVKYEESINMANQCLNGFLSIQLPSLLLKMQSSEYQRIGVFKQSLNQIHNVFENFSNRITKFGTVMKDASTNLNVSTIEKDMADFILFAKEKVKKKSTKRRLSRSEPKPGTDSIVVESQPKGWNVEPFVYDLNVKARDLIARLQEEDPNYFIRSLSEIMNKQRTSSQSPFNTFKLPRQYYALKRGIKELGGYTTEGIFRITCDTQELNSFVVLLEDGDYNFKVSSPHVLATAFKKWLRDLQEPVVPFSFYDSCIAMGKRDDIISPYEINDLLNNFPLENRLLIKGLIKTLREVSSPENFAINRMSVLNLAVVFAPSMLRPKEVKDESLVFIDSKKAINFVVSLINHADVEEYPLSEEETPSLATYEIQSLQRENSNLSLESPTAVNSIEKIGKDADHLNEKSEKKAERGPSLKLQFGKLIRSRSVSRDSSKANELRGTGDENNPSKLRSMQTDPIEYPSEAKYVPANELKIAGNEKNSSKLRSMQTDPIEYPSEAKYIPANELKIVGNEKYSSKLRTMQSVPIEYPSEAKYGPPSENSFPKGGLSFESTAIPSIKMPVGSLPTVRDVNSGTARKLLMSSPPSRSRDKRPSID